MFTRRYELIFLYLFSYLIMPSLCTYVDGTCWLVRKQRHPVSQSVRWMLKKMGIDWLEQNAKKCGSETKRKRKCPTLLFLDFVWTTRACFSFLFFVELFLKCFLQQHKHCVNCKKTDFIEFSKTWQKRQKNDRNAFSKKVPEVITWEIEIDYKDLFFCVSLEITHMHVWIYYHC